MICLKPWILISIWIWILISILLLRRPTFYLSQTMNININMKMNIDINIIIASFWSVSYQEYSYSKLFHRYGQHFCFYAKSFSAGFRMGNEALYFQHGLLLQGASSSVPTRSFLSGIHIPGLLKDRIWKC